MLPEQNIMSFTYNNHQIQVYCRDTNLTVDAEEVYLPGIKNYRFFIHESVSEHREYSPEVLFTITELSTGCSIVSDISGKRRCIEKATELLNRVGTQKFINGIVKMQTRIANPFEKLLLDAKLHLTEDEKRRLSKALNKNGFLLINQPSFSQK